MAPERVADRIEVGESGCAHASPCGNLSMQQVVVDRRRQPVCMQGASAEVQGSISAANAQIRQFCDRINARSNRSSRTGVEDNDDDDNRGGRTSATRSVRRPYHSPVCGPKIELRTPYQ